MVWRVELSSPPSGPREGGVNGCSRPIEGRTFPSACMCVDGRPQPAAQQPTRMAPDAQMRCASLDSPCRMVAYKIQTVSRSMWCIVCARILPDHMIAACGVTVFCEPCLHKSRTTRSTLPTRALSACVPCAPGGEL